MKTTATNRKIRELLSSLKGRRLIPRPDFQRRLVWNNKDKSSFLETVLLNYPFPEIYVAAGEVNVETGEGTELLVDGQQRLTTLLQYFQGSPDLVLHNVTAYADLSHEAKENFLQYDVVVRDLGRVEIEAIRSVFQRINATKYALNAMEIQNSRYEGEFKSFAEEMSQSAFFEQHRVFSASEVRRMQDVRFLLVIIATSLSTYFNRDDELEEFLDRYNDEFPMRDEIRRELESTFAFIESLQLPDSARIWKKADLFTAIVELHAATHKRGKRLDAKRVADRLQQFYLDVDDSDRRGASESNASRYYKAALQATTDRGSRILRGMIFRETLDL